MVTVESWHNPELITPEQSAQLDEALTRDLDAMADPEPETEAEAG